MENKALPWKVPQSWSIAIRIISLYKKQVWILLSLSLLSSLFALSTPFIYKLFIDKVFLLKSSANFIRFSILGGILYLVTMLFTVINSSVKNSFAANLRLQLNRKFLRKIYSYDLGFFLEKSVGENMFRCSDLDKVKDLVIDELPQFLGDILRIAVILFFAVRLDFKLTICLVVLSPLFLLRSLYFQRKLTAFYEGIWRRRSLLSKELAEAFAKITIIKSLGLELFQRHKYSRALIQDIRLRLGQFRWSLFDSLTGSLLSNLVYAAITLYGGWLILKGRLTLGSYTAIMLYLAQLSGIMQSCVYNLQHLAQESVSVNRFFEIMDNAPERKPGSEFAKITSLNYDIRFEKVSFSYQPGKPVLKDVSWVVPAKTWVTVLGPSGSGKTTLVNLLLGLYPPVSGRIFIGAQELKDIPEVFLHKRMAVSTQQPLLFDVSIKENIVYGLRDVGAEQVEAAAKIACIHDYIWELPDRYDTIIGEDACRLSMGQKQRIAIARALVRQPDILILDEAASSVDLVTEERIVQNLKSARQGLSTIVITHRVFTLIDTDSVCFIGSDGMARTGLHADLLKQDAQYNAFFSNNQDSFLTCH